MTRRSAALALSVTFLCSPLGCESMRPEAPDVARVDPLVGTGGLGFAVGSAFPGAAAPHGLAKAGPDTSGPTWGAVGFLHCAGYWSGDDTIQGFSNLHLHGTGLPDYGVLSLMPLARFDGSQRDKGSYQAKLRKDSEQASPGYYSIELLDSGIRTEITATVHASHYRIRYPGEAHLVLDLDHSLESGSVTSASIELFPSEQRIAGQLLAKGDMSGRFGGYTIYFEIRTRTAWTSAQAWSATTPPAASTRAAGTGIGVALDFASPGAPVELQIGLSMVSAAGARANLAAEMPSFDFDGTRLSTAAAWKELTDRVQITGGTVVQQHAFLSALYHLYLMPTDVADVDGSYTGQDHQRHQADGFRYVSDMSLWDTYRTLHPLYSLIAPEAARDAVRSLVAMADQSGAFPKWPLATGETGVMLGASAEVVLADAYVKGVTDFDAERAYQILHTAATSTEPPAGGRGGRDDVVPYMDFGYIPSDKGGSVSKTTEYAYDDFALGNLAAALGHPADAALLHTRAQSYRQLYDASTGFLRGRSRTGGFATSAFDPTEFTDEYVEANAWQSSFYAAHDIDGLAGLFGGREQLVTQLSTLFEQAKTDLDSIKPEETLKRAAQRPYYWGGNEPDIQAPFMFAQAGRPDLTQKWARWAFDALFGDGADGLPGNDDGGAMSAWYVFAGMGLYPIAGSDRYVVGAPVFSHIVVAVAGGRFTIDAQNAAPANIYVQSVTLDGAPLAVPEVTHAALHAGGTLGFVMGPQPSTWGR